MAPARYRSHGAGLSQWETSTTIADQFSAAVEEMLHRGWSPNFLTPPSSLAPSGTSGQRRCISISGISGGQAERDINGAASQVEVSALLNASLDLRDRRGRAAGERSDAAYDARRHMDASRSPSVGVTLRRGLVAAPARPARASHTRRSLLRASRRMSGLRSS